MYDKKDPARVCIYCGQGFISRENKRKHDLKCSIEATSVRSTHSYICCHCAKTYKNQEAMVSHARKCTGDNARTSPIGDIALEGPEIEIVFPDKEYVSDPHTAGLQTYSPTPQ